MNMYLLAAGILAGLWALLHLFAGGKAIAVPLLAARDLEPAPKYVNYYCWHLVSFNLAMMAAIFLLAATGHGGSVTGWLGVAQAGFYFLWGVSLPLLKGVSYATVPQGWLFAPVVILGLIGMA